VTTSNDVWEALGELAEEDALHDLLRLLTMYDEQQQGFFSGIWPLPSARPVNVT